VKKRKHTTEQVIRKLREAEAASAAGKTVAEICQALEVSEATFHRWQRQYGGMHADEVKRMRGLEEENRRLKKLVADLSLDKQILEEALKGKY
jgi:transposase-like protein